VTGKPSLVLIAAVARNGVIGDKGDMPWRLSTDLKRFKRLSEGKAVIMGRHTFDGLKKPLVDRLNIVVTHDQTRAVPDGVRLAASLEAAIGLAEEWAGTRGQAEIVVAGGAQVYRATMSRAERLYITHVEALPDGDAFFPPIDPSIWLETSREAFPAGEKDSVATQYVVYQRRLPVGASLPAG
jgi:dihydrofolate reductase